MSVISLRNAVIVAGALAIMGAGKTLVLNANELDLQYQKLIVPKGSLHAPVLGAAYALDHSTGRFRPTKICNLFVGGTDLARKMSPSPALALWQSAGTVPWMP